MEIGAGLIHLGTTREGVHFTCLLSVTKVCGNARTGVSSDIVTRHVLRITPVIA